MDRDGNRRDVVFPGKRECALAAAQILQIVTEIFDQPGAASMVILAVPRSCDLS